MRKSPRKFVSDEDCDRGQQKRQQEFILRKTVAQPQILAPRSLVHSFAIKEIRVRVPPTCQKCTCKIAENTQDDTSQEGAEC